MIKLYKSDVDFSSIVPGSGISNSGSYNWTIPDTLSGSNDYKIKIEDYNNFLYLIEFIEFLI